MWPPACTRYPHVQGPDKKVKVEVLCMLRWLTPLRGYWPQRLHRHVCTDARELRSSRAARERELP